MPANAVPAHPDVLRYAAFATSPLGGNPAGVVLDADGMDDATMQQVAADVGYSETAFLFRMPHATAASGEDQAIVRYFSPLAEVPFCGHATVAAAVARAERTGPGTLSLHTRSGVVRVRTHREGGHLRATLTSVPPRVDPVADADLTEALAALRWDRDDLDTQLPPRVAYAGAFHLVLAARSRQRLSDLSYDFDRLQALTTRRGWTTVQLVHRSEETVFHSRNPFPSGGVYEDPATGAAAAALGGYLPAVGALLVPARLVVHQGHEMGRPSTLVVDVPADPADGIAVTGTAVPLEQASAAAHEEPMPPRSTAAFEVDFEDRFGGGTLDSRRWLPYYLPQWSSREQAAARYVVGGGELRLRIEAGQQPWCSEFDADTRVSSIQTGVLSGPAGSGIGQHRFNPDAVVREPQEAVRLYTPQYGIVEARVKALDDPRSMVALWMIGFEDEPDRSAEICVFEIFGRDVAADEAWVGMGLHPFGDPRIADDFEKVRIRVDVREFHVYRAEWTPGQVAFFVDGEQVKVVAQSPSYPMQLMLGIYEFGPRDADEAYPKEFVVDYIRAGRP